MTWLVAALRPNDKNCSFDRQFSFFHSRTILNLQDEIIALEKKLDGLDRVDIDEDTDKSFSEKTGLLALSRECITEARTAVLDEIKTKLSEYEKVLRNFTVSNQLPGGDGNGSRAPIRGPSWFQSTRREPRWEPFHRPIVPEQKRFVLNKYLGGLLTVFTRSFFTRISSVFTILLLAKPVTAQSGRYGENELRHSPENSHWIEWVVGGFLIGIAVLVLASIYKNPGNAISQRLKRLPAPAMAFSSVAFLLFRNGDSAEAKMAWAPFLVWFVSIPAYVRAQQDKVVYFQLYMLSSAMLTGVLMCTIGMFQQTSLAGGVVTVLPVCAAFSVFACGVAFRARVKWSFSPA